MNTEYSFCKYFFCGFLGSVLGELVEAFKPTFPLAVVAVIFIVYDAWTAFQLDRRVREKYPEKTKREKSKFTSFAFGKVVTSTIPKRLWLILLAFIAERWVFVHVHVPLSYIAAGAIVIEQGLSILENESSCREEADGRFWKMLQRILIDKTERHFDVTLDEYKKDEKKRL